MMRKRNRLRLVTFGIGVLVILVGQWLMLSRKIVEVEPNLFANRTVVLQVTSKWQYGYIEGYHGAVLVKARNVDQVAPMNRSPIGNDLGSIMARELGLIPRKAVLEGILYVILLGYILFGVRWLNVGHLADKSGLLWDSLSAVLSWVAIWTIAIFPLLVWGYGASLYTNWVGPGSLTSSGPYFGISFASGRTISYRTFIEAIGLYPSIFAVEVTGLAQYFPRMPWGMFLWIVGLGFYGMLGLLVRIAGHLIDPARLAPYCGKNNQ